MDDFMLPRPRFRIASFIGAALFLSPANEPLASHP
jgi:hypothetical protein